jgi:hypothetical protein
MSGPQVVKTEGLRGIFRGLGTTICREVPGFGTYFLAYELMTRPAGPGPVSTFHMLLAGGLSGTLSWVVTYPIDVVKSRLQVDGMGGVYRYTGFMDCLKKSIQAEGYCVMTRGLWSTVLRAFPTNAATFTVVTWVIRWADANCVETTSGYVIAELVDLTAPQTSKVQTRINDDQGLGIKVFGLLENMEYKEKYMKSIFEWRKRMLHNFIGSDIFPSQQLMSKSSKGYSSGTGDGNQSNFCDNIKDDLCLQTPLFQGSKMDSMDRGKEQGLNKGEDSEERDETDRQKDTDSKTDKEPNTYEHKNDYYNSSVR